MTSPHLRRRRTLRVGLGFLALVAGLGMGSRAEAKPISMTLTMTPTQVANAPAPPTWLMEQNYQVKVIDKPGSAVNQHNASFRWNCASVRHNLSFPLDELMGYLPHQVVPFGTRQMPSTAVATDNTCSLSYTYESNQGTPTIYINHIGNGAAGTLQILVIHPA